MGNKKKFTAMERLIMLVNVMKEQADSGDIDESRKTREFICSNFTVRMVNPNPNPFAEIFGNKKVKK